MSILNSKTIILSAARVTLIIIVILMLFLTFSILTLIHNRNQNYRLNLVAFPPLK